MGLFFMEEYIKKAKKLKASGFWMAGYGNFDITTEELAQVLKWIEEDDFDSIRLLYMMLQKQRL